MIREFLLSDEFRKYRKAEMKLIVKAVESNLWEGNRDQLKGIMTVARVILHLPTQLCASDEARKQLETGIAEDWKDLTVSLVRETIK